MTLSLPKPVVRVLHYKVFILFPGLSEEQGGSEGEDDGPLLQKLESNFLKSGGDSAEGVDGGGKGGDLFSEIHLNEVKKLERQLEQLETEKGLLFQRLREAQDAAEHVRQEAATRHVQLAKLDAYLASLLHLHEPVETPNNVTLNHSITLQKN